MLDISIWKDTQLELPHFDRHWHSNGFDVQSFRGADCDTNDCLVVAEVSEKLAVSKRARQKFVMGRFSLKKVTR
jgi:hypothetical protein